LLGLSNFAQSLSCFLAGASLGIERGEAQSPATSGRAE